MQTMREPSASLEEIMKLGPIQIYFGTPGATLRR
jgi:hypothetical protein